MGISEREYQILTDAAEILEHITEEGSLIIDYAKICYCAMKFAKDMQMQEKDNYPVDVAAIYKKLNVEVRVTGLNENLHEDDKYRINRIIGKISVRPDYFSSEQKKVTVYVDENEKRSVINYALAHELCHLLFCFRNTEAKFYTDNYCTMPMLPESIDELVADAFAIFLLIPFDKFLDIFKEYIQSARARGALPIGTDEWLNYLSAVTMIPYYYVACGYQQIRHVASMMYKIHTLNEEKREEFRSLYGDEIFKLYDEIKIQLDDETVYMLYQS